MWSPYWADQPTDQAASLKTLPITLEAFYWTQPGPHMIITLHIISLQVQNASNCENIYNLVKYSHHFYLPHIASPLRSCVLFLNDPTQFEQVDETCEFGGAVLYSESLDMTAFLGIDAPRKI